MDRIYPMTHLIGQRFGIYDKVIKKPPKKVGHKLPGRYWIIQFIYIFLYTYRVRKMILSLV